MLEQADRYYDDLRLAELSPRFWIAHYLGE